MNQAHALTPAILLLLVGVVAMTAARRVGLSPIVGYLAAGLLIGPHALGLIHESETTHLLAELGVVFLLFDIGLHFSLATIRDARRDIFGLGPLQILLCALAFGALVMALGQDAAHAVILGGALALSSTAAVVPTLAERGQQSCPVGRTGTAVLIVQDVCAIFLLILAASMEYDGPADPGLGAAVALALVKAALAFGAALALGRFAIGPLFRVFSRTRNEEVFTALALLVVLSTAAATGHAGLSLTLGAFLGGMIIAETPYRHLIQTEAKPFRNLLLGFFFITVGMSLDWRTLVGDWAVIIGFVAALVALKAVLVAVAARAFGWSLPGAIQLGFLLAQGSEFVFVIVAMPAVRGALGEATAGVLITGVAISLALTPTLAELGNALARWLRQRSPALDVEAETRPRGATRPVVVFGMDEVGRAVADALEAHGVPYDAVESDHERFLAASADGYPVAFGDPGDIRLMETLAYGERAAIVVTAASYETAATLKPILQERYPRLTCFVAVASEEERQRFEALGLRPIIDRSLPPGLDLAAAVLRSRQIDEERIRAWMRRERDRALRSPLAAGAAPAVG